MTYLPYLPGYDAYIESGSWWPEPAYTSRIWFHRQCWVWLDLRGGKVINTDLPMSEWKIEFKDDADAVYFRLKFGK
jgi:hypothetical protein